MHVLKGSRRVASSMIGSPELKMKVGFHTVALLSLRTFGGPSRCPFFLLSPCNFGLLGRGLLGGANMDGMKAVIESSAPLHFWGEVILTTCHVLNRMPHKNSRTTPFEMWK